MTLMPEQGPEERILELATAGWKTQAVHAFAEEGIADHLASAQKTIQELTLITGVDGDALSRLMAYLVELDLVEVVDKSYSLTPAGALLKSNAVGSMRGLVRIYGDEFARGWQDLTRSLRTGAPSFPATSGEDLYSYLDSHPDRLEVFAEAMAASVRFEELAGSPIFSDGGRIIDLGGGVGHFLAALIKAVPHCDPVLFERPAMAKYAERSLTSLGLAGSCTIEVGDFFMPEIPMADRFLLSRVLHDWTDSQCIQILGNVRAVMQPPTSLVIVERMVGEPHTPQAQRTRGFDLHMLVTTGGRERTYAEYEQLCAAAGLSIKGSMSLPLGMQALEASLS